MEYRTFSSKDPFKPSLHYSLRNIFLGRKISTRHPAQLSRIPYPALEFDSPRLRKNPLVKPPLPSSLYDLADIPYEDAPLVGRDPTIVPVPSPRRSHSPISLPLPHSLVSPKPQSKVRSPTPPSPGEYPLPADMSSYTKSSVSYFSSHHSDDEILRDFSEQPTEAPLSPKTISSLDQEEESRSGSNAGTFELVTMTITDKGSSSNSSRSTDNGNPVPVNDESLQSIPFSKAAIRNITGEEVQKSPDTSLLSLGPRVREDLPVPTPDICVEARSLCNSKMGENEGSKVVLPLMIAPAHEKHGTIEDLPTSPKLLEICSEVPSLSLRSSIRLPPLLFPEKKDTVSELRPPTSLDYIPSTPSSKTVDVEIVSTPSGCDDNTMFGIPSYALAFILDTIPRQLYLYFLLFLPSLYFSRVSRIFIDSQLSVYEIDKCILDEALERHRFNIPLWRPSKRHRRRVDVWSPYDDLEESWQTLTDSFMREWNTLNIISGLLLTAIITILQIGNAGEDPLIRHTALLSMICALMSLLYGCMYIIRFGTMQKTYKGAEWAYEADKPRTAIFWNVWVMLAMPATWLGWSILMFIVCIGSFIWRTGTTVDENIAPHTPHQVISARVVVSFILAMGVIYFTLIVATLREYGDVMDTAWMNRISGWVEVFYEHQRMQELRMEAMHDIMHEVRHEPPIPVMEHVVHMPEREYFMDRQTPLIRPRFEFAPPPPIPVFSAPHHTMYSTYVSDGLFGPRSPAGSLFSHRRSPTPPLPAPAEPQSEASLNSRSSSDPMIPPSQPPPQVFIPPTMTNYPPYPLHITIPPPAPQIMPYSHEPKNTSPELTPSSTGVYPGPANIIVPPDAGQASPTALDSWFSSLVPGRGDRSAGGQMELTPYHDHLGIGSSTMPHSQEDTSNIPENLGSGHGEAVHSFDQGENLTEEPDDSPTVQHQRGSGPGRSSRPDEEQAPEFASADSTSVEASPKE